MKLPLGASALLLFLPLLLAGGCSFEQSGAKADGRGTGTASATDTAAATGTQVTSGSSPQSPGAALPGPGPAPGATPVVSDPVSSTPDAAPPPSNLAVCQGAASTTLFSDIATSQTLSGNITVSKAISIAAGATVTVSQCATFTLAQGAGINVLGTLNVTGSATGLVPFQPASGVAAWAGISVKAGGSANLINVYIAKGQVGLECQTGAAGCALQGSTLNGNAMPIHISSTASITDSTISDMEDKGVRFEPGANATVTNSIMYASAGDVVGVNGGHIVMTKVKVAGIGYAHCGIHINEADYFEIHQSNISANYFAFMIGPTTRLIVSGNNILQSQSDHFLRIGDTTTAFPDPHPDLTNNYWAAPPGLPQPFLTSTGVAAVTTGTLTTQIANLGPTIPIPASLALAEDEAYYPTQVARGGENCPL